MKPSTLASLQGFEISEVLFQEASGNYVSLLGTFPEDVEVDAEVTNPAPRGIVSFRLKAPQDCQSLIKDVSAMKLNLRVESESEYGYFVAIGSSLLSPIYDVELIYPASEKQIQRKRPTIFRMAVETPSTYASRVKPYIEELVSGSSVNWIKNILEGRAEIENVLLDDKNPETGFMLLINPHWTSHPNPKKVDISEWKEINKDNNFVNDLNVLALVRRNDLFTLRDLRSEHIPMLRNMMQNSLNRIQEVYGLESDRIRVFVHYHPQFYHFHVHFRSTRCTESSEVARAVLFQDILMNLESDSEYYTKRDMICCLSERDKVFKLITQDN